MKVHGLMKSTAQPCPHTTMAGQHSMEADSAASRHWKEGIHRWAAWSFHLMTVLLLHLELMSLAHGVAREECLWLIRFKYNLCWERTGLQEVHKGIILFDKNKGLILYTAVFSICSQCCFQGQQEKLRHWLSFPADQRACGSELTSNEWTEESNLDTDSVATTHLPGNHFSLHSIHSTFAYVPFFIKHQVLTKPQIFLASWNLQTTGGEQEA